MASPRLAQVVRNVDRRLARVEQILPTLATRAELAPLATRAELKHEIAEATAPLATKAELGEAIAAATAPLATKAELKEESERTRRYFDVVAERLEGRIGLLADGLVGLREHMDERFEQVTTNLAQLDRRVTRLESAWRR